MGGLNKSLKEKFEDANNKRIILTLELAALLHDIGKLSSLFLQYRQKWQKNEDGWNWNNDPHCNEFFKKDELLKTNFKNLLDLFQKDLLSGDPGDFIKRDSEGSKPLFSKFTIQDSVHYHEKDPSKPGEVPSEIKDLIKVIKAADSFDAAWDRNNPLFYSDQTEGDIFETNVFGKEYCEDKIDFNSLDEKREKIYETLKEDLSCYLNSLRYCLNSKNEEERRKILETIKENSHRGTLSVTNRPDNDTSLWEHSYAVASLVKVILGHYLIYEELLDQFGKVRFGIFGVGWDGISFISKGQKIGDILGRKRIINELKSEIKKTVEFEFCLGNSIYEDDNGIYFLIPAFLTKKGEQAKSYEEYLKELESKIIEKSYEISKGDLMPHFYFEEKVKNTQFITHLTLCIQELRKRIPIPVLFPDHKILKKEKEWPSGKTICPICQRRPIIDETKNICETCLERRGNNVKDTLKEGYTPFASEIALANPQSKSPQSKKLCLIIARFELENWLNGRMIRTLFVKNAPLLENEVKNLGRIKDFINEENKAKDYFEREGTEYNFRRIKKEITNPTNDTIFLYSRRNKFEIPDNLKAQWERLEISAREELQKVENREHILENVICAKTPTPSTILDVWMTTQEFNQGLNGKDFFPEKKRPVLTGINKKVEGIDFYAIYKGKINNISCEVVPIKEENGEVKILIISHTYDEFIQQIKDENKLVMEKLEGKTIKEIEVPFKKEEVAYQKYYPLRLITQSPELYLAIVPADSALQFTNQIYKKYIREYGKVIGRLPFAIGNIFFDKHMPMFIVLDAARRLLKTFERNSKKPVSAKIEEVEKDGKITIKLSYAQKPLKSFSWQLPYRLGNNDIDYHHPFFILSSQANLDYNARKTLFPTVQGNVIHFSELKGCDTIEIYPNFYKFRFLDATTRRYELYEPESEDFALQIYTVEDIEQTFEQLWSFLLTKITDTSLRHIEELLSDKLREWADDSGKLPPEADRIWEELAKVTIISAFGFKPEEIISSEFQFLMRSLKSKAFFDLIELYARILKRRLEEGK